MRVRWAAIRTFLRVDACLSDHGGRMLMHVHRVVLPHLQWHARLLIMGGMPARRAAISGKG